MQNDLATRIGRGDRKADENFVDLFGARVHRLARRYAQGEADAEDLTQEIFVDLFRSAHTFRGESHLATWVYRVALNHCLRHQSRALSCPTEPLGDEHEMRDSSPDPSHRVLQRELAGEVHGAVEKLSAVQRDVVVLHELHGLTYAECARVLDVPIGTVKSRLSNAFRALRQSLGGYVLGDEARAAPINVSAGAGGEAA